jgi:hypothetical protein
MLIRPAEPLLRRPSNHAGSIRPKVIDVPSFDILDQSAKMRRALKPNRNRNKTERNMSKVFAKAIEFAVARQEWEKRVNPSGEIFALHGLSEAQLDETQAHIVGFQSEINAAAKAGAFKTPEAVKALLDKLDYEKQYLPLWRMSETCLPITEDTAHLAQAIAPARAGTVDRIRDGKFGIYDFVVDLPGVVVHKASTRSGVEASRQTNKEAAEEQSLAQSKAFEELSGAMGVAMKGVAPGKTLDAAKNALEVLGGVRMVEGEKTSMEPVVPKGAQMKLFGEDLAPTPPGAGKKRSAKPGK